jgi:hypothetical protein
LRLAGRGGPPENADLTIAQKEGERIDTISRAALKQLGRRMAPFRESFFQSMADISGGSVRLEDDRLKITPK